jgi:hypothetical protein
MFLGTACLPCWKQRQSFQATGITDEMQESKSILKMVNADARCLCIYIFNGVLLKSLIETFTHAQNQICIFQEGLNVGVRYPKGLLRLQQRASIFFTPNVLLASYVYQSGATSTMKSLSCCLVVTISPLSAHVT